MVIKVHGEATPRGALAVVDDGVSALFRIGRFTVSCCTVHKVFD